MKRRHFVKSFFCLFTLQIAIIFLLPQLMHAQQFTKVDPGPFADNSGHWYSIFDKSNIINPLPGTPKYKPTEITKIADNILLFQKDNGGWPKNYDIFAILTDSQKIACSRQNIF